MKYWLHFCRRLGVVLLALGALAIAVPAASANASDRSLVPASVDALRNEADRLMSLDYMSFIEAKEEAVLPSALDFTDNGCSGPAGIKKIYADLFDKPCQQHDFGYRNYGIGGLELGPDEDTRAWIDARFAEEMDRVCDRNFKAVWQTYNKIFCKGEAAHVYAAVRNSGEARDAYYS